MYDYQHTSGLASASPKNTQDLRKSYGTNWTKANVSVLFEWITIASYNIRCLELATGYYRKKLRLNTILGIVLATLSGTGATVQAVIPAYIAVEAMLVLNILFVIMTFTIAIMTGYIKVYQIQENLEHNIKIKQEWISFSTELASELQLPTELRRDALWMIIKNKSIYLELLKVNLEIPPSIASQARKDFREETKLNMDVSSLPRILIDISLQEMRDLDIENKDDRISSVAKKQLRHLASSATDQSRRDLLNTFDYARSGEPKKSVLTRKDSIEGKKVSFAAPETKHNTSPAEKGSIQDDHQIIRIDMGVRPANILSPDVTSPDTIVTDYSSSPEEDK